MPFQSCLLPQLQNDSSNENDVELHENGHESDTHFHMNGFAGRLVLEQRQKQLGVAYYCVPTEAFLSLGNLSFIVPLYVLIERELFISFLIVLFISLYHVNTLSNRSLVFIVVCGSLVGL